MSVSHSCAIFYGVPIISDDDNESETELEQEIERLTLEGVEQIYYGGYDCDGGECLAATGSVVHEHGGNYFTPKLLSPDETDALRGSVKAWHATLKTAIAALGRPELDEKIGWYITRACG